MFRHVIYFLFMSGILYFETSAFPSISSSSSEDNLILTSSLTRVTTPVTTATNYTESLSTARRREIKRVENCDPNICQQHICRVKGSISRPSFYARCPATLLEDSSDDSSTTLVNLTTYCTCSAAYHASTSDHHERSYIRITPDTNCVQEETLCDQKVCQGESKRSNRQAHICQHQEKFYCACFN